FVVGPAGASDFEAVTAFSGLALPCAGAPEEDSAALEGAASPPAWRCISLCPKTASTSTSATAATAYPHFVNPVCGTTAASRSSEWEGFCNLSAIAATVQRCCGSRRRL